jgi:hypothetical protein
MKTIIFNAILFLLNLVIFILSITMPRMMNNHFLQFWSAGMSLFCGVWLALKIKEYIE